MPFRVGRSHDHRTATPETLRFLHRRTWTRRTVPAGDFQTGAGAAADAWQAPRSADLRRHQDTRGPGDWRHTARSPHDAPAPKGDPGDPQAQAQGGVGRAAVTATANTAGHSGARAATSRGQSPHLRDRQHHLNHGAQGLCPAEGREAGGRTAAPCPACPSRTLRLSREADVLRFLVSVAKKWVPKHVLSCDRHEDEKLAIAPRSPW